MIEFEAADGAAQQEYARTALFLMSAACEHPSLTPQCPFAVEVRPGVRVCQEQCHDILRAHGLPLPAYEDAPKTQALQPPVSAGAPFDASALYLQAQNLRPLRWSLPALIWALKQHVTRAKVDLANRTRQEEVELCLAELARRDFDVDSLVRLGMRREILEALLVGLLMSRLARDAGIPAGQISLHELGPTFPVVPDLPEGWDDLLDAVLDQEDVTGLLESPPQSSLSAEQSQAARQVRRVLSGSLPKRLNAWLTTAALGNIVGWRAPSLADFTAETAADNPEPAGEQFDQQRWLAERFTLAYYGDWSRETRNLEFRWLRNDVDPPCGPALMDLRERREDELARTIAVAVAVAPVAPEHHLASLRQKGLELLLADRRAAAAGVFEVVRELNSDLPEPHNNYGFALLPDAPGEALTALELARTLGYKLTLTSPTGRWRWRCWTAAPRRWNSRRSSWPRTTRRTQAACTYGTPHRPSPVSRCSRRVSTPGRTC